MQRIFTFAGNCGKESLRSKLLQFLETTAAYCFYPIYRVDVFIHKQLLLANMLHSNSHEPTLHLRLFKKGVWGYGTTLFFLTVVPVGCPRDAHVYLNRETKSGCQTKSTLISSDGLSRRSNFGDYILWQRFSILEIRSTLTSNVLAERKAWPGPLVTPNSVGPNHRLTDRPFFGDDGLRWKQGRPVMRSEFTGT